MSKISVITPHYNMDNEIVAAIASVENQSDAILEYIIIDDCSSKDSYTNLEKIVQGHTLIKLFRNHENCGSLLTANRGAVMAKGDLLIFLGADDRLGSNVASKMIEAFYRYPEASLIVGDIEINYVFKKFIYKVKLFPYRIMTFIPKKSPLMMNGFRDPVHGAVAVSRSCFLRHGSYRSDFKWHADTLLHLELALSYGIVYLPMISHHFTKGPSTFGAKSFQYGDEQKEVLKNIFLYLNSRPIFKARIIKSGTLGKHSNVLRFLLTQNSYRDYINKRFLGVFLYYTTFRKARWLTLQLFIVIKWVTDLCRNFLTHS